MVVIFGGFLIYTRLTSEQIQEKNENEIFERTIPVSVNVIFLVEAAKQNITVSKAEIDSTIQGLIIKANMTEEEYSDYILTKYPRYDDYLLTVENNLKILKLINKNVDFSGISVTDADVDTFLAANPSIAPTDEFQDPTFKEKFYRIAKQQIYERKKDQLIQEYLDSIIEKNN